MRYPEHMNGRKFASQMIRLVIVILPFMFLVCLGEKGDRAEERVPLVFWHSFVASTVPALNDLIVRFEREYPKIDVRPQYVPTGDALLQKLVAAVQSRTAPDIAWKRRCSNLPGRSCVEIQ